MGNVQILSKDSPLMSFYCSACINKEEKTSVHVIKKEGDMGHPYLKPLTEPFIIKEKETELMHFMIKLI